MTEVVPSLSDTDGTPPIDPSRIEVGQTYYLNNPDEGRQTIEITDCHHGTDESDDPQPTVISYTVVDKTTG